MATAFPGREPPPLGLVDLSPLPRAIGARRRAQRRRKRWPRDMRNASAATAAGDLVLRLSDRELLVMTAPGSDGEAVRALDVAIPGAGAWPVPRRDSHCAFTLRGDAAVDRHKLCGVDLRPTAFPAAAIAQTSVARSAAVVCRPPDSDGRGYLLLADSASAIWFWDVLLDAMAEFDGGPLGLGELGKA
ncbi:MAG: hypothetical protein U5K73_00580 [Halofilum sp. (in: g-proteobacteria)]|nr:hypothetical protein [Halofilum sp. (in: g-proteobacteria)]